MIEFKCYEIQLDDKRSVELGYNAEKDCYLIIGKTGDEEHRIALSSEAMHAVIEMYLHHLKYQAQCAPDGVGAEL